MSTVAAFSAYVPYPVICPSTPLVRPAAGLSSEENTYRVSRKVKADVALGQWLQKTNLGFGIGGTLPTVHTHPYSQTKTPLLKKSDFYGF